MFIEEAVGRVLEHAQLLEIHERRPRDIEHGQWKLLNRRQHSLLRPDRHKACWHQEKREMKESKWAFRYSQYSSGKLTG
jgi:hypothetical protein